MRRELKKSATHGHEGQTRRRFGKNVWSALQTHLQGVDRATLAIMPENRRHRAAPPLSVEMRVKITRPAREGKPRPPIRLAIRFAIPGFAAANSRRCSFLRTRSVAIVSHPGASSGEETDFWER
jgi:hypothetical protein